MAFRRNLSRRDCVEMLHHLDWETPYLDYVLIRYAELRRWDWKLLSGRRTAQTGDQPAGTHPALFQTAHREEVAAGDAIIRPRSCIFGRRWDAAAPVSVRRRPFRSPCRSTPDAA